LIFRYNFSVHLGDIGYADDFELPLHIEPSSGRTYEAVYDLYQRQTEPFAAVAPYMVAPGNHDVTCHATGDFGCPKEQRNFSAFRYRFRMPSMESRAVAISAIVAGSSIIDHVAALSPQNINNHHNMWYSWQSGSVHFVSVNTESDFPNAPSTPHTVVGGGAAGGFGDQLAWLRSDLAMARNKSDVKWIVAFGHRPWYSSTPSEL